MDYFGLVTSIITVLLSCVTVDGYKRVCYFTNWSQNRAPRARLFPEQIDPFLCTHIMYSFYFISKKQQLQSTAPNDADLIKRTLKLKSKNKNLVIMLSVGGANPQASPGFTEMVSSKLKRATFINNAINFLRLNKLDGIDLDWEYPGAEDKGTPKETKEQFAEFVKEIREAFDEESKRTTSKRLILSAAVAAGKPRIDQGYMVPTMGAYLDFINVMTYDLHGAWDKTTGFNSPLYGRPEDTEDGATLNADWVVKYWQQLGAPNHKINLGFPTYGRSFQLTTKESRATVGAEAEGPGEKGKFLGEAGVLSYYEICDAIKESGSVPSWDETQKNPYVTINDGKTWIGFDNARSFVEKAKYVRENELGGAVIWALDLDDFNARSCGGQRYPLIRILRKELPSMFAPKAKPKPKRPKNGAADAKKMARNWTFAIAISSFALMRALS